MTEARRRAAWRRALARYCLPGRLSSGTKMLFIITAAFMPLGLIALLASFQSAAGKRLQHEADARLVATAEARQIDLLVYRSSNVMRFAAGASSGGPARCRALLIEAVRLIGAGTRIALFAADGTRRCASRGVAPPGTAGPGRPIGIDLRLLDGDGLRLVVGSASGAYAVGVVPLALLRAGMGEVAAGQGVELRQGAVHVPLVAGASPHALDRQLRVAAPIAGGQLTLVARSSAKAVTSIEVLLVLLPILMWAAAAIISWVVVHELLLRPLGQLQRAVAAFGAGEAPFTLARLQSPAREIDELRRAFTRAAEQIAEREDALAEGLRHQVRLTREVHHRVKNNLQVVASLINLHSRGTLDEVAAAYASIQRRVDALAVVHRNHYAELEENRGVALRALVAELVGNLRATAPPAAAGLGIGLDMVPVQVSQDVAVPVAFLLTELVELVINCAPTDTVTVGLVRETDERALLTVASPALTTPACREHPHRERFDRIITGLSRQLRSRLTFDPAAGAYAVTIAVLAADEPA